ncbi:MAG: hypothetical protein RI911_731 [Candidatus Parcubacteria bacterium]|jgi:hypothetical protein
MNEGPDRNLMRDFRAAFYDGKRAYEQSIQKILSGIEASGTDENWGVFNSTLRGHKGYFQAQGKRTYNSFEGIGGVTAELLELEVRTLHEHGIRVIMADYFGQGGPAVELGADAVVTTSLAPFATSQPGVKQCSGDGLSEKVSKECFSRIDELKSQGHAFHSVFFRPVGGQNKVDFMNPYVVTRMYQLLVETYNRLDEGGRIFFVSPHPQMSMFLQEILGGSLRSDMNQMDSRFMLVKREGVVLPTLRDIAEQHPTVLGRIISMYKGSRPRGTV